ncbi:MAG: cyclase family protein [Desulfovibrio desulfuricans]|uniref:Cyclase family protein n=1 Tax=Desulfovibrio desulfuricans (strain ATCC 27774 / DSM 6949 / MB) TaxID=525146 RepID=B8IYB1_DESDA|nr:cyclase family protein [uncultured Desulfovibrio sp.]MDY0204507.1 cyclase family protein [Desulfovibrio desulfuricans]
MLIDLSLPLTRKTFDALSATTATLPHPALELFGHVGTHLDLMGKAWPQEYFTRQGRVFDVRHVRGRDITASDLPMQDIEAEDFVFLRTGVLEEHAYADKAYVHTPVELAWELLENLTQQGVAMIGVDCAGVRLPGEHRKADLFCAEAGTFVVENVYNLGALCTAAGAKTFVVRTFPLRLEGSTGLPCRIVAELAAD